MNIGDERQLASICRALLGKSPEMTLAEWRLAKNGRRPPSAAMLSELSDQIRTGSDPLGETFLRLRTPEERRQLGATYTPDRIIASMIRWASEHGTPARIVDPGAGSGRFLLAAADAFPDAELVAVECDPLAALMLRANLSARHLTSRATVHVSDYRLADVGRTSGSTLFIGNPPYVRHHQISGDAKAWFASAAKRMTVPASKLAGLHVYFFLRTAQLAQKGDFGCFITSSEWLDVNYGITLRRLLGETLGGTSIHVLAPEALPFSDAMTTGAITCFRVGTHAKQIKMRRVKALDSLNGLKTGKQVPWPQAKATSRWSTLLRPTRPVPEGYVELGEICSVHRGQVTGSNAIWIDGPHARNLPKHVLLPSITKGRELIAAGEAVSDPATLRRVIDLPEDLDTLSTEHRRDVEKFLNYAKSRGAHEGYIARHRRAWWAVGLRAPAPILVTYMARRPPAFVRNLCEARHINIAHGIYPREKLTPRILDTLTNWLRKNVRIESGRTYAGGLTKFEPREIERILVPSIEVLSQ